MKKKITTLALAILMCGTAFAGCGASGGKKEKKTPDSAAGEYYRMAFDGKRSKYIDDLDDGLEDDTDRDYIEGFDITLSKGKFEIGQNNGSKRVWFEGDYYVGEDDMVYFEYQSRIMASSDGDLVISLDKDDTIDDYSYESKEESAVKSGMLKMSETGTFPILVAPAISFSDIYVSYNIMPMFIMTRGTNRAEDQNVMLKHKGDFLCVDTYGFKLNGSYDPGKDFTVDYNPFDAMMDDENYSRDSKVNWDKLKEILNLQLDTDGDYNTTIEFSDGFWWWYNSSGDLLNKGEYQESKDHPGLVSMYVTEDSEIPDEHYMSLMPVMFYIDGGRIYYPSYIKAG